MSSLIAVTVSGHQIISNQSSNRAADLWLWIWSA